MLVALRRVASSWRRRDFTSVQVCFYRISSTASASFDVAPPSPTENRTPVSSLDLETLVLNQYSDGKFRSLLRSVISQPSVLLAACYNLAVYSEGRCADSLIHFSADSVGQRISIDSISSELKEGAFDLESCCEKIVALRKKGEHRVLPNLKLKVIMEAIRMVLQVVYEKRFVTFSYGGRVGMGRHTAIRYLKTSVPNPTWWFRLTFCRERFGDGHVRNLIDMISTKIEDGPLIGFIERLFSSEAVVIELGGLDFSRGFPQESALTAILLNIYLDVLDHEIQALRLRVQHDNPKILSSDETGPPRIFHNPLRVFAVRYLDEILIITSGNKMFTMDIKDKFANYLESRLGLRPDKLRTSVHSAVSENIGFMGMELQAVSPSVLHPPMSEKASRAHKKYLKRKAAMSQELKNARETRRRHMGTKILNNAFKKLQQAGKFEFEYQIENEVREAFRNWADEVVRDFLSSKGECWNLHRALISGDFLELKKIRDQLPVELVEAYDCFRENVDKYLGPQNTGGKHLLSGDEEQEVEEINDEEEIRYSERTVEDLTKVCIRVNAPIELVRKTVKMTGFTNSMGRPRPIKLLVCLNDSDIVKWYAGVGKRWLDFYCCCRNFKSVKTIVDYHLRFSCILTLAEKHESRKVETIKHYKKDLRTYDSNGAEEVFFPTEREIKMMGDRNLSDPTPVDGALCLILVKLVSGKTSHPCVGHFCERKDVDLYRIRLLQSRLNVDPLNEKKWVPGLGAIHECLNKKCLPLCLKHAHYLYLGNISLQDVDCTSFVDVQ